MILQKVRLVKAATADNNWVIPNLSDVGQEFWVRANTIVVMPIKHKDTKEIFKCVVIRLEDGIAHVPVELLEFSSDFRVE
jgi:hypothetical protein